VHARGRAESHRSRLNRARSQYYWTGVAMLLTLAWLCFASWTPLRQRWYEMFKVSDLWSSLTPSTVMVCSGLTLDDDRPTLSSSFISSRRSSLVHSSTSIATLSSPLGTTSTPRPGCTGSRSSCDSVSCYGETGGASPRLRFKFCPGMRSG